MVVRQLVDLAPGGSIAFVTEGGYDLIALRDCLDVAIAEASKRAAHVDAGMPAVESGLSTARAERALDAVRAAQKDSGGFGGLRPSDSPGRSLAGPRTPHSARVGSLARSFAGF